MNMDSVSDLLEIAGEDDSLLSDNSSTSANIFSCSPLVSIRSRPLQTTQPAAEIEITSVVSEDLTSKCTKPESPESQQSQQKKRKKKFGGFNLRKSLAWDRAFFTEQGVLNPTELSMISGTATPNSKSNLEVIDEEELGTTSIALQKIEENLFKHSSGGVSIRDKKIGAVSGLTPKPGASVKRTPPIASLGKRKVLATNNDGNKYKRSAIPRAVPSSSLKITDTAKMPSKESKITGIPGPKSNVSANATTTRSGMLSSGSSKRNQNAHPSLPKNPTPSIPSLSKNPTPSIPRMSKNPTPSISSLSKNPTYVPSIPKVDMADKCSVSRSLTKQAGKLSDTPVSILRPPSRMDQTTHQTGTIKSSGLRKPSPSIGFFSQVKASGSHSLQKSSIPCKPSESNIPKLRKLGTVSVKEARSKIVKGAAKNRTKELSHSDVNSEAIVPIDNKQKAGVEVDFDSSSFEIISKQAEVENILDDVILKSKEQGELHENEIISSMENMVLPTHEKEFLTKSQTHEQLEKDADHTLEKMSDTNELSLSDVKPEAIVQIDNKQMAGVEVDCDSSIFEIISKQAEVENILDDVILKSKEQGELHENEIISSMENMVIPTHENELLKKSQTHEQLEKEADHTLDNKLYDVTSNGDRSSYQEPQSTLFPIMQRTSNTVQNTIGQDEDDQIKGPTGDIPPFKESLILQAEFSGEFKGYKSAKTALLNSSLDDFCKTVPEGSKQGTPCKNTEQVNCGADEFGRYEGDAQGHLLNESLIINCKKTTQSNLDAVSQQLQADQPKALNPSGVEEIGPEKENISDMNSSQPVHVTSLFSKGSPENSILGINDASEDESKIIEIKDCQLPVDDQLGFILRSPVDKECDQVIDSKAIRDRTPEFELDRLSENCITVSASSLADDNNINEDSYLPGFQKSSAVVAVNSQDVHLDSDFLPKVIVSSTEIKEQNLVEDAFEGCGFHSNEHNATNHHIEDMSVNIEGNHDVDGKVELLQINDVDEKAEFLQINDVDEKMELLQINDVEDGNHDVDEKVELLQINDVEDGNHVVLQIKDVDEKVELLQINDVEDENHDVDEKVELLQINGAEDGNRDVDEKVELLQINDVDEMVELLQINDVDEKVELLQLNDVEDGNHDVDEKVELLQINGAEDGNRDVDEKVELLQINGAEDKNRDVDEKVELLQINNVDEKVELLQINDVEDGNHDVDEKVELLRINGAEDGNCDLDENVDLLQINDVDEKVEHLQINDVDEKVEILQINDVEDGNHDVDGKVELLQIIGAEDGNRDLDEKVELLQINDVDEKVELLQINDVDEKVEILQINDVEDGNHDVDKKVELLQINGAEDGNRDVDEKVELLQINGAEDGNHDVDEKVELLQINGADDGNCDVDEKVELLQINDVDEKVELLQINDVEDGNHDVDEKVELLQINGAEDGNHDVEDKVELLQINDAEEGLSDILPLVETQLNMNFFSSEFDSSIEVSEDPFSTAVSLICEKQCSLSENSKLLSSDMLVNKDGNQGVDEKVELLQINGAEEGSLDISPSVEIQLENVISAEFDSSTKVSEDPCLLSEKSKLLASENSIFNATIPQGSEVSSMKLNENAISAELGSSIDVSEGPCLLSEKSKLLASENSIFNATIPEGSEVSSVKLNRNAISADLDSSIQVSEGPFTSAVAWKSEEQCLLSEKSKLLDSDNSIFIETILQGNEVGSVNSESLSDAAVTTVFENDKSPNTDMASQSKDKIDFPEEDNGKIIHLEIDATKTKQEVPIAKPPLNVAPFTEEWLAAIEAAGEEILMMKSGAVQNSPPDKVQNEPNPWSPVKKNQEIGPFDCTKITKHNIQSSDPS